MGLLPWQLQSQVHEVQDEVGPVHLLWVDVGHQPAFLQSCQRQTGVLLGVDGVFANLGRCRQVEDEVGAVVTEGDSSPDDQLCHRGGVGCRCR